MDENRLKMNSDKTEFILMGSKQQLQKASTSEIVINGQTIERRKKIKYLGADLDEELSLKEMINRKCRIAMGNLQKLKKIRKFLTLDAAKTIALGLVISHLDYANALYSGLPATEIKKLQRIQNMAAKIVTKADRYDSSTEALKSLHWLPIHLRIEYKVLTLVFKSLHGLAPQYLCDLIQIANPTRPGLRSESKANTLKVPFTKHSTFADRGLSVHGPRAWNELKDDVRSTTNYNDFKKKLKTFLFEQF